MDLFIERVQGLDDAWDGERAEGGVELTLDGRPVRLDADGGFGLPAGACGGRLVASDGAGGRTALRVPTCRQAR